MTGRLVCVALSLGVLGGLAPFETRSEQGEQPVPELGPSEVVTEKRASVSIDGNVIKYVAAAGTVSIVNDSDEPVAGMFYVAYLREPKSSGGTRPVTFIYNGGPGSSSALLGLGSIAPVRVDLSTLLNGGTGSASPVKFIQNSLSILDRSDLVFLDAVGTGYSRPVGTAELRSFCGIDQDIDAFARAIRRWLTINDRWNSPKFLMGESYGGTRSAGLAALLPRQGVSLNGVIFLNAGLDRVIRDSANDAYYVGLLPTYAATAWYHRQIEHSQGGLEPFLEVVHKYAQGPYLVTLQKGRRVSAAERDETARQLSRFTGIPTDYIIKSNLRVDFPNFRKQLLSAQNRIIGQLDTRFTGVDSDPVGGSPESDPVSNALTPVLGAAINDYLRRSIGYRTELTYRVSNPEVQRLWDWRRPAKSGAFPWVSQPITADLSAAMRENAGMRVLALLSYFDLAVPFAVTEYNLAHLAIDDLLQKNVTVAYYSSGHAVYMDDAALHKMKADISHFMDGALRAHPN